MQEQIVELKEVKKRIIETSDKIFNSEKSGFLKLVEKGQQKSKQSLSHILKCLKYRVLELSLGVKFENTIHMYRRVDIYRPSFNFNYLIPVFVKQSKFLDCNVSSVLCLQFGLQIDSGQELCHLSLSQNDSKTFVNQANFMKHFLDFGYRQKHYFSFDNNQRLAVSYGATNKISHGMCFAEAMCGIGYSYCNVDIDLNYYLIVGLFDNTFINNGSINPDIFSFFFRSIKNYLCGACDIASSFVSCVTKDYGYVELKPCYFGITVTPSLFNA